MTIFYQSINEIFNECVPKSTQVGKVFPTWYNGQIVKMIEAKERFLYKFKRTKISFWWEKYRELRSKIKLKTRKAYTDYIDSVELILEKDPKYFWSYICNQKNYANIPSQVSYNDLSATDTKNIANLFAQYFSSVFITEITDACYDKLFHKNYFCNQLFCKQEIREAIKKLKDNRSVGLDGIPGYIIKGCGDFLIEPLLHIFNISLQNLTYLTDWLISKVIPLFKKGAKNDEINYRPVTILNAVSKVYLKSLK